MMKRILILLLVLLFTGCGGRLPTPTTAHRILTKHFEKYGKKFRTSDFGQHKVEKVEIFDVLEIQKDLAEVDAYASLKDGHTYKVRVTLQKKPFGWKELAWENLGMR